MSDVPIPPPGATLPPPPDPPAPQPETDQPRSRRRGWLVGIAAGVGLLVVIGIVSAAMGGRHRDDLPSDIAELHRLHTSQVQVLEDQVSSFKLGDVDIEIAGYGSDQDVQLVLFRYSHLPSQPSISAILRGAGGGIVGTGGTVDFDAQTSQLRDGVEYACIPFTGRLFADDTADSSGQVCAWAEGRDIVVVMDARASDVSGAVDDAASAHAALG
jgi:hypothetical protein